MLVPRMLSRKPSIGDESNLDSRMSVRRARRVANQTYGFGSKVGVACAQHSEP